MAGVSPIATTREARESTARAMVSASGRTFWIAIAFTGITRAQSPNPRRSAQLRNADCVPARVTFGWSDRVEAIASQYALPRVQFRPRSAPRDRKPGPHGGKTFRSFLIVERFPHNHVLDRNIGESPPGASRPSIPPRPGASAIGSAPGMVR
jgi:hypothetical protein